MAEMDDHPEYKVVINHEGQYSIWPSHRENPGGWSDTGKVGPKADCLSFIATVWVDLTPLGLQNTQ